MEKPYRICFLGYRKLFEIARDVVARIDYNDTLVVVKDCLIPEQPEMIQSVLSEGYEVFIAGSSNAAEFRNRSYGHLVEIEVDIRDYLLSIRKASLMNAEHIGIAAYRFSNTLNPELLRKLTDIPIETFFYETSAELYSQVRDSNCDVLIGASFACEAAENLGIKSILIYEEEYTIRSSIEKARRMASELRRSARENEITAAILHNSPSGIIVTDEQGRITTFNAAARKFTNPQEKKLLGKPLEDIIPSLSYHSFCKSGQEPQDHRHIINGAMIRCVQTAIRNEKENFGMLTTLLPDNSRRKKSGAEANHGMTAEGRWNDLIGNSASIQAVLADAKIFALQDYPLMIKGEGGTGKRFLAQCVHNGSPRAKSPYLVFNAATVGSQDAARVLFGTESHGEVNPGLLELAAGGSIVLQDIPQASDAVKACLLQVLTEHSFFRIGGTVSVPFSARFITLAEDKDRRALSEDFWHRLSVFSLTLPPLRERREDIVPFFQYFLLHEGNRYHTRLSGDLAELLEFYSWPGNLAALAAVCKRYSLFLKESVNPSASARHQLLIRAIGEDELLNEIFLRFPSLQCVSSSSLEEVMPGISTMKRILHYNNSIVADKLGLGRTTLWRMQKSLEQKL
ncbi:MAG: sigma 54-interacting transcriptional regulator [Oscillospiraceae bacterium]|nr:sigma 54-interacting transcriptional regulator [Oscillospiraceae bacterium]